MALTKTGIDYLTHCWNFYTGCEHWKDPNICPVGIKCWAKQINNRFKRSYEPTFHPDKLLDPLRLQKPGRIGVCFTGDLGGDWVDPNKTHDIQWIREFEGYEHYKTDTLRNLVFEVIEECPQHQFFFLTKNPKGLRKWGQFPQNAYVGATACNRKMWVDAIRVLREVQADRKWLSDEPMMERIIDDELGGISIQATCEELQRTNISWITIGGWSRGKVQPKIEWVKEMVEAADRAGIPVFIKNNLEKVLPPCNPFVQTRDGGMDYELRHELPVSKPSTCANFPTVTVRDVSSDHQWDMT